MGRRRFAGLIVALVLGATLGAVPGQEAKPGQKPDSGTDRKKIEKNDLPLDPVRTVEFETDEGTWISLDVTPDGQAIVFELLGDILAVTQGASEILVVAG